MTRTLALAGSLALVGALALSGCNQTPSSQTNGTPFSYDPCALPAASLDDGIIPTAIDCPR